MEVHKKLLQYSSLAFSFLLLHEAEGEVVYTDINPDTLIDQEWETYGIDMNNDSTLDFTFWRRSYSFLKPTSLSGYITSHFSAILVGPVFGNSIAGSSNTFSVSGWSTLLYYPYAFEEGAMIDESLDFQTSGNQLLAFRYRGISSSYLPIGGQWYPEILDRYLGVYFKDTTDCCHYGWIRCDVKNDGKELVIKDYAFEKQCNTEILAGDVIGDTTTVGLSELNTLYAIVYSFNNTVNINLNELISELEVFVYDVAGKKVYSDRITNLLTQIELIEPQGTYIVTLISPEGMFTKKIFIN